MKTSTRRIAPALEQSAPGPSRATARVTRLRPRPSGNDANLAMPPSLGEEAWPWHMVPPIRSADRDTSEAAASAWPFSHELYQDAQSRRAALLGDLIAGAMRRVLAAALGTYRRYRQFREERATYEALHQLDDRSLRDLGFVRDEIRSVAAEITGRAERTRRTVRAKPRG